MQNLAFSPGDHAPAFEIYQGLWINWSHGRIFGRILTISRQNADLVIAFTGVFITFVGVRFWRILSLACHRSFSSSRPQGALYHQRQVILRNSPSADSAFITFFGLLWAWRHTSERTFRALYLLIFLSVLCSAAFIVAGGFSSRISTLAGTEVLLRGSACGSLVYFLTRGPEDKNTFAAGNAWSRQTIGNAFNYAQQCYSTSPSRPGTGTSCMTFVRPQLPGIQNKSASCPFQESLCRNKTANLHLDSGYLDSHFDLGLNAPPNERILLRNVLHCAPLVTEGNMVTINDSQVAFNYGPAIGIDSERNSILLNHTYTVENFRQQYMNSSTGGLLLNHADYRLK